MQSSLTPQTEYEYVPRDDESEAARLESTQGVGETVYLNAEEIKAYSMTDYGLGLSFDGMDKS